MRGGGKERKLEKEKEDRIRAWGSRSKIKEREYAQDEAEQSAVCQSVLITKRKRILVGKW